jgi:hypothetical protein
MHFPHTLQGSVLQEATPTKVMTPAAKSVAAEQILASETRNDKKKEGRNVLLFYCNHGIHQLAFFQKSSISPTFGL